MAGREVSRAGSIFTPRNEYFRKPLDSIVRSYFSGRTLVKLNKPSTVVTVVRTGLAPPVSSRFTVALGIAAPEASVTDPLNRPVTWARPDAANNPNDAEK